VLVVKLIYLYYFFQEMHNIYILRIFASYSTVSRFHTYKYYSFVVQIQ